MINDIEALISKFSGHDQTTTLIAAFTWATAHAQPQPPVRGSIIEDRAARKLIQARELRYDAGARKAIEIWKSVVERYPRSKVRFNAHLKLGEHHLTKGNAYDKARVHFEAVASRKTVMKVSAPRLR